MWAYYQTVENGEQTWKASDIKAIEAIRKESAYHSSIYYLNKLPESSAKGEIKYKGDLWFDIDHKPNPSEPNLHLIKAIEDTQNLIKYLRDNDVDTASCEVFASGSKGFHIKIPAQLFGATAYYKTLPKIHKYMAQVIEEEAELNGVDLQLYSMGKGKLLRVENKLRSNGKYKVPITLEELTNLTPENYIRLTSNPRDIPATKSTLMINPMLSTLFEEALSELNKQTTEHVPTPVEHLTVFRDSDPTCLTWLTSKIHIRPEEDHFNRAKMSLARYLANVDLPPERYRALTEEFYKSYTTSRNKETELNAALKFGKDEGFSCQVMQRSFTESPCKDCILKVKQLEEIADSTEIEESEFGYYRKNEKGKVMAITNFTLIPVCKHVDNNKPNEFLSYDYQVKSRSHKGEITLRNSDWLTSRDFRQAISRQLGLQYVGSDIDLQYLKTYLTRPEMEQGLKTVRNVPTVGIYRHKNIEREIDEFVWVDSTWSINASRVANTLNFSGTARGTVLEPKMITLDFKNIEDYSPTNRATNEALTALLASNIPYKIGGILGWMCACWLRSHIRDLGESRHLPNLHLHGESGAGKTETAVLYAAFAGADYYNNSPMVISGSTQFALEDEGAISTTVPRIFDEFNNHKISNQSRYKTAVEVIKGTATSVSLNRGGIEKGGASKGVMITERVLQSPIIYMGTNPLSIKELEERSVSIDVSWPNQKTKMQYAPHFRFARSHAKDLWPLAKEMMVNALNIDLTWVKTWLQANYAYIPEDMSDRIGVNWVITLTGLDYFYHVCGGKGMPEGLLGQIQGLKETLIYELKTNININLSGVRLFNEIDIMLDTISVLAATVDNNNVPILKDGIHYCVSGEILHLFLPQAFNEYIRYKRLNHERPEIDNLASFKLSLNKQPYSLGTGLADVDNASDWYSFDTGILKQHGINIYRFKS